MALPREIQCHKHSLLSSQCRGIDKRIRIIQSLPWLAHRLMGKESKKEIITRRMTITLGINAKGFGENETARKNPRRLFRGGDI